MSKILFFIGFLISVTSCNLKENDKNQKPDKSKQEKTAIKKLESAKIKISISTSGFNGSYRGLEFSNEGPLDERDVAHRFSNKIADTIGYFLKQQNLKGIFLKVDFKNTQIRTSGLDLEKHVVYTVSMPFLKTKKCEGYTGIEHCGSWTDEANLELRARMQELQKSLKTISVGKPDVHFFKTPEMFQEYWIQFKHKEYQADCK